MSDAAASRFERIFEVFAVLFSGIVILIAISVMTRYALHSWPTAGSVVGFGAPNPAGAILAALTAFAVLVRIGVNRGHGGVATGKVLAAIVLCFALLKIVGAVINVDVVFDRLLFADQLVGPPVNRLTEFSAAAFALLGGALLLQFYEKRPKLADLMAVIAFLVAFQGAIAQTFGPTALEGFGWERPIAFRSILAVALLSFAVLLARPKAGLAAVLADRGAAGAAARRLLPAAFLAPFLIGLLLASQIEPGPLRLAHITFFSAIAFCIILAVSIGKLGQIDRQRLQAMREISARSARDRVLMESIGDGVFAVDLDWRITFWNKGAERITGFDAKEAVGKLLRQVLVIRDAETREENMAVIERAMHSDVPVSLEGDNFFVAKDGHDVPIGDSAAPLLGADGESARAIIVFRDATTERELAKLRQDFLFRTIHDLRSPANIISLLIQNFHESSATAIKQHPEVIKGMQTINELNDRMRRLVEDLQEVAKGTDPAYRLRLEPVEVAPMVDGLFAQLAAAAAERRMTLEQKQSSDVAPVIADRVALTEVLENLVGNAIKYGKDGGLIRVSHEVNDGMCKITVWDDGTGISPENLPSIFAPYFRVAGTGKPGTGLGLYIVHQLVEKMGGKAHCDSEFGKWTAFTFTLPLA